MNRILIIGGYGHVGTKIARRLIAAHSRVTIAGRDGRKARAVAAKLGCQGVALDLNRPNSWDVPLSGADIVICCLDTRDARFARAVLQRGARYIDISATDAVLHRIDALDAVARDNGALAVLSVGMAPGLTNLMARAARDQAPNAQRLRIGVLLGLGDSHGTAAIDWTLNTLGPLRRSDIMPMRFGDDRRGHPTIGFDFADQHTLMRRGYPRVETRLALASPLMTRTTLLALAGMAARPRIRAVLGRVMPYMRVGNDRTALMVEAFAPGQAAPASRVTLEGRQEAEVTALMAAEVALRLAGRPERGVSHIDELWRIDDFRDALAAENYRLTGPGTAQRLAA